MLIKVFKIEEGGIGE